MSFSALMRQQATVIETLTVGVDDVSSNSVLTHNGFDTGPLTLDSTTTPPVTEYSGDNIALVAGAKTIDLTNLLGSGGRVVTLDGLKPYLFRFRNRGANAMTIVKGASSGYTGFGSSLSIVVPAGYEITFGPTALSPTGSPAAVSATVKTLDVTGTGSQTFDFAVGAGA